MTNRLLILIIVSIAAFSSCETGNVLLDNGGETPLRVTIDAVAYTMPAGSLLRIDLEPGLHQFSIKGEDQKILEEGSFQVVEGGTINAGKIEYLIWTEWYGDQGPKEEVLKQEWIKVDDTEIFGEFERIPGESIYMERRWDFNLDEDLPESVKAWELTDKRWVVKRKLFHLDDAMMHYQTVSAPTRP